MTQHSERKCPRCQRVLEWYPSKRLDAHLGDGHGESLYPDHATDTMACGDCLGLSRHVGDELHKLNEARKQEEQP